MNKNLITSLLFSTFALCANGQRAQLFDADWRFSLSDDTTAYKTNFDDAQWRKLDLPHDWSIEGGFAKSNPTGGEGGYVPAGKGWYRKTFTLKDKGNKVYGLYFEGVYMNSEVYVNGTKVGGHPYGYSSFYVDITKHVKPGAKNTIAVKVDNSMQTNCRWYSGSGIYRHVHLIETAQEHIAHWGVAITTPEVSKSKASVNVSVRMQNESAANKQLSLRTTIYEYETLKSKDALATTTKNISINANGELTESLSLSVDQPKLWSPSTPHIYKAKVEVLDGNKVIDEKTEEFGIRKIEFSAEKGMTLNGESIILNGGCLHHDNGILGAAAFDQAEWRKAELMKAGGFNAARTSHNHPSEEFLRACDHVGLLVIDEAFDGWRDEKKPHDYHTLIDQWWESDVDALVLRDRNHPSIMCWSNGNEVIERKKLEVVQTSKKIAERMRMQDPERRPVTQALAAWDRDWEIYDPLAATLDITGYNYMIFKAESDHERVPERVMWQTESYPRDAFRNWKTVVDHTYVVGDFVWTALDYLGESSIGAFHYDGENRNESWIGDHYPWHGAYCGDIDITGWRKPISHYRDMLYNSYGKSEKIYMGVKEPDGYTNGKLSETMWSVWPTWESWNWKGHEGKPIDVEIYSRYDKVRLYFNDKLIGEKSTGLKEEFKAVFNLPYTPGTLKAVGVNADGSEDKDNAKTLSTTDEPADIRLTPSTTIFHANGQSLSFVTVEIVDKNGNVVPNADNEFSIAISGPGTLQGAGNANLKDETSYVSKVHKVWNGRAMIVVRSQQKPGKITLSVTSGKMKSSKTIIATK